MEFIFQEWRCALLLTGSTRIDKEEKKNPVFFCYQLWNKTRNIFAFCFTRRIKLSCQLLIFIYPCFSVLSLWYHSGCCVQSLLTVSFTTRLHRKRSFMKQTAKFSVSLMLFSLCVPTSQMIPFEELEQPTHWKLKRIFPPRVSKPAPDVPRTRPSRHDTPISMRFHVAGSWMPAPAAGMETIHSTNQLETGGETFHVQ